MLTCNIFKKDKTSKEGKRFASYLTRITNKDTREEVSASVKFEDGACNPPKSFPIRIDIMNGSVSSKNYTDEKTGEERKSYTVWVRDWKESEEKYVDDSLDNWK